jgi:beta-glucosidase-like glycosyl hydrolase
MRSSLNSGRAWLTDLIRSKAKASNGPEFSDDFAMAEVDRLLGSVERRERKFRRRNVLLAH